MPLAVVGGFRSLRVIQQLHQDFADYISICRPFIREPDLIKKFREEKGNADCISCNKCLTTRGRKYSNPYLAKLSRIGFK